MQGLGIGKAPPCIRAAIFSCLSPIFFPCRGHLQNSRLGPPPLFLPRRQVLPPPHHPSVQGNPSSMLPVMVRRIRRHNGPGCLDGVGFAHQVVKSLLSSLMPTRCHRANRELKEMMHFVVST